MTMHKGKAGYPVAVGMSLDGTKYVEQIQFVNGCRNDQRAGRFILYLVLDAATYMVAEIFLFPLEICEHAQYGRHMYFIVYDDNNRIVKAIDMDSPEGHEFARLAWSVPKPEHITQNLQIKVRRFDVTERISLRELNKRANVLCTASPTATELPRASMTVLDETVKKHLKTLVDSGLLTQDKYMGIVLRTVGQSK